MQSLRARPADLTHCAHYSREVRPVSQTYERQSPEKLVTPTVSHREILRLGYPSVSCPAGSATTFVVAG